MAKYNCEFKQKVVQIYMNGEDSYKFLAKNIIQLQAVHKKWVASYKEFSKEVVKRSKRNKKYSLQFKL